MPDTPELSLLDRMNARYNELRKDDSTIRRFEREIQKQTDIMRTAHQVRKVAKLAIREQEKWLKEESAEQIRREAGVKTIPGFASRRESAREFRARINEKLKAANAAGRTQLSP